MKALVIDDSRTMRMLLKRILAEIGVTDVTEAEHGLDAFDKLRGQGPFDVALVDWNMPEMSGYDLVRMVRTKREYDAMRIMMVTTESEMEQMVKALEAGADEYVMKPFTPDVIKDKLALIGVMAA